MAAIARLETEAEARACARLMATSEPWITLGRSFETSLGIVRGPTREVYLARDESGIAGFLILCLTGAFVGYIQTVCIDLRCRRQGLGSKLAEFAEDRILQVRWLYEQLGYQVVGELTDYLVHGHSEILLRKTVGPLAGFTGRNPSG